MRLVRTLFAASPELVVLVGALVVGLGGLLAGLPLVVPDASSLALVERHYFRPFIVAVIAQALAIAFRRRPKDASERWYTIAPALALIAVTIFVHFNLKAWMPLVHPRLFDAELIETDRGLDPIVSAFVAARHGIASTLASVGIGVDSLYHTAFVGLFFVAFSAHALFDSSRGLRRVVLAACLVLLLGGLLYWVFPAKGPFMYRDGESRLAEEAQRVMVTRFDEFVRTRVPPPGYFVAPLAAMPSLHVAHTTLFTVFAFRRLRWLFWPFLVALAWMMIEAVATGWHYVVDLPVGMALALLCFWLSERALPDAPRPEAPGATLSP